MEKTCFLFSGQGSQFQGMGKDILEKCPTSKKIYECGSDILGFDLMDMCFNAQPEILAQTQNAQPAIFATSLVSVAYLTQLGIRPNAVAGHSLGEYAAMVASEMLSLEQGFQVIKKRAFAMSECTKGQDGAMAAIIGLEPTEIENVCASIDGYVVAVNYNSPKQTVIAGDTNSVDLAISKFADMGKKAIKLAVSAAFHSKLMGSASEMFYDSIKDVKFAPPIVDFYCNVTGEKLTDFSDMSTYLKSHLVSPVKFSDELALIQVNGITRFIECGPNKVLTGLVKKTLSGVTAIKAESLNINE